MKTFFIADLHFSDINIMKYENRPFDSVELMNEKIVENWNRTVSNDDEVFLLGDIGKIDYISQLNGTKYLINLKVVKYILKTLAEYYTKFFKIKRIT